MKIVVLVKNNQIENIVNVDENTPMDMFASYTVLDYVPGDQADIGFIYVPGATHRFQPQNPNDGTVYSELYNSYISGEIVDGE